MKALVYTAPNEMTYRDEPEPVRGDPDVLIEVDAVGICGSDMHAYHGHDPRRVPPLILGHEVAGRIIEGPGTGRRVTVNPLITCGRCDYCREGRDNLCSNRTMIGMTRPGGFAERFTTAASSVIDIPQDLSVRAAALIEPAGTVVHALHVAGRALLRPAAEGRVLVIGGGAIGMLTALLLKNQGVHDLTVAETNALRRASVEQHTGAAVTDPTSKAAGIADNSMTLVIDAVGNKHTRDLAFKAIRPGGVILHIGLQDWASEIDMRKLTLAEITLIGTYTYSTADLRAAAVALHAGAFGTLEWVEERPLAEGTRAFKDLHEGRTAASKIILKPR